MRRRTAGGIHPVTTTISHTLWEKAIEKNVTWAEALRRGLTTILSELGDPEYINPLMQQRKIEVLARKVQELSDENNTLRGVKK